MHYKALLLLLLPMQHLLAMDLQSTQALLENSAHVARHVASNMSPEALAAIRQSSSFILPHPALTSALQFATIKRAASMGQQQKSELARTMLRGMKTGAYYSGKGLYYGGEAIIKALVMTGKTVLAWATAGLISLVGISGVVAGGVYLYKNVNHRLSNIYETQQAQGRQLTIIVGTQEDMRQEQQRQGVVIDGISNTQNQQGVTLGVLATGQEVLTNKVDGVDKKIDDANDTLKFLTRQMDALSAQSVQDQASLITALKLQKEELLEAIKDGASNVQQIQNDIIAIDKRLNGLEQGGVRVEGKIDTILSRLPAGPSSSQPPLLITNVSPPRSRSPLPSGIQDHLRSRSPSPPIELPGARSSYIDLPFGNNNDIMKILNQHGSLLPSHKSGGGHALRLMDRSSK